MVGHDAGRAEGAETTGSELVSLDDSLRITFDGALTVGRHSLNDLVIDHPRISSRHAALEWIGLRWRIRDLGSRNGTSVNKRCIRAPRDIREGDVIRFAGLSAWRVEVLGIPSKVDAFRSTETVASKKGAGEMALHLSFVSGGEGTIRVVRADTEWSVTTGQRFILLYVLAKDPGQWIADPDLKLALWGRAGIYDMDPSALHKLIHDTRRLFEEHGIGGWIIEKQRGRTRLVLPTERIHRQE